MKTRVLVVDDDLYACDFLEAVLAEEDYEVSSSRSASEAIKMMEEKDFDIALTDFRMPGMNGIELLKDIKAKRPHMKTIMMTAYGEDNLVNEAHSAKVDGIIYKPFEIEGLLAILQKVLSKAKDKHKKPPTLKDILIVDDEGYTREFLQELLEEKGYSVCVVQDGSDVFREMENTSFNIVLLDVLMPGINGVEVLKMLKKKRPDVPIVIMTAYVGHKLVHEALDEGQL